MLLYDVLYADQTLDKDRPLPAVAEDAAVAVCTNWDRRRYIGVGDEWVPATDNGELHP